MSDRLSLIVGCVAFMKSLLIVRPQLSVCDLRARVEWFGTVTNRMLIVGLDLCRLGDALGIGFDSSLSRVSIYPNAGLTSSCLNPFSATPCCQ